jgi:hypothetical protein
MLKGLTDLLKEKGQLMLQCPIQLPKLSAAQHLSTLASSIVSVVLPPLLGVNERVIRLRVIRIRAILGIFSQGTMQAPQQGTRKIATHHSMAVAAVAPVRPKCQVKPHPKKALDRLQGLEGPQFLLCFCDDSLGHAFIGVKAPSEGLEVYSLLGTLFPIMS